MGKPLRSLTSIIALVVLSGSIAIPAGAGAIAPEGYAPREARIASARPAAPSGHEVWFAPLQDEPPGELAHGSVDFFDLFERDAPWKKAAGHVDVFKIYGGWILNSVTATDARIRKVVTDLERRGFDIAFEVGPLNPTNECGLDVEGFSHGPTNGPLVIDRIRDAGASVEYIAMDEPLYYASLYDGPQACHWPVAKVAKKVKRFLAAVRDTDPRVVVGDIEPLTSIDQVESYKDWMRTFARVTGHELPFFHVDIGWYMQGWPEAVAELERFARGRGIDFGVIYDGGGSPPMTDLDWAERAEARMAEYEVLEGGRLSHVIFQSWSDLPDRVLPETRPGTFTWLIGRYFRTRTELELGTDPTGTLVTGELRKVGGAPIADAEVVVSATPSSGEGAFAEYTFGGTVPEGAVEGIAAFRVNTECGCASPADLTLYEARYTQGLQTTNRVPNGDFDAGLDGWSVWGDATIELQPSDRGGINMLHVQATASEVAAANSTAFPVTPGATFTATFGARVSPSSESAGYFALVFLSPTQEVGRPIAVLEPASIPVGTVVTAADGSFEAPLPELGGGSFLVEAIYAGSDRSWPAYASVDTG
ncbi:MAG TPA: hypothetical protein VFK59_02110 [Actinomycetota bacterium]|nr:hypothetical protein [Actinomycetota bacterium]